MHAFDFQVTAEDIKYAESKVFKNGGKFDDERVDYISSFDTFDLQAVPGSGKQPQF